MAGHGLEAWGLRLGNHKIDFNDFSVFTEDMLTYCIQDVNLNHDVYNILMKESIGFSDFSIRLEHSVAELLQKQEANGFALDVKRAEGLVETTGSIINQMEEELRDLFKPKPKLIQHWEPKYTKGGDLHSTSARIIEKYSTTPELSLKLLDDGTYELYELQEFNPASSQQKAERLIDLGWKPKKFTDKGAPKTDRETLLEAMEDLSDYPQVKTLANYELVSDRFQKASKWLELAKVEGDNRVHGRVNPIGASTHRCAHFEDNMANIASVVTGKIPLDKFKEKYGDPSQYQKFQEIDESVVFSSFSGKDTVNVCYKGMEGGFGWDSRACWITSDPEKNCIVGADASGIQLRALAHYINDPEYTKNLISGDIHVVHQKAAGISTRDRAKTFIYAWLLGAGDPKIGYIVEVSPEEYEDLFLWAQETKTKWGANLLDSTIKKLRRELGRADKKTVAQTIKGNKVKAQFLERIPALKHFKTVVLPKAANDGFVVGLDGRKIWVPSEHLSMGAYLQGFEAVIMKMAMVLYTKELNRLGIWFKQVAFVHDEFQIECRKEDADIVGKAVVKAIEEAGVLLESNCPLTGEYKKGPSWATSH